MTQAEVDIADKPTKKSKLPIVLSLVFALVGGGGGFYASWSGLFLGPEQEHLAKQDNYVSPISDVEYIEIDPLVISLRRPSRSNHLRFRAQLEVPSQYKADVEKLLPRVTDVLNSYLRAVKVEDFDDPAILARLKTQMLHRVEIVVGAERVRNLLVMEFVFT
jgi:flagellar FliL protein